MYCEDEEPEVEEDPTPALLADQLPSLVCGEGQLFTDLQLVELMDAPSQDPVESPAQRDIETELALQPVYFPWIDNVKEQEAALLGGAAGTGGPQSPSFSR